MRQGITAFKAERLTQVREANGLTKVALSNLIKVSGAAISKWESGKQFPEESNLLALSNFFNMPIHWFLKETSLDNTPTPYFFRSRSTTSNAARNIAKRKLEWTHEISLALQKWVELPEVLLPKINEDNFLHISDSEIEDLSLECRELWGLGLAPIPDVILAMESAGILCVRDEIGHTKMDGVSHWYDDRPYTFISSDKANGIRNRFDAAHELGHIILHKTISDTDYKKYYKEIERQANLFAGTFLLPSSSFAQNIALTTLDGLLSLKRRWKVSLAAMIMRCHQLKIIDDSHKLRLYKSKSARGWAVKEPYDDLPAELPRLLHRSIKMIVESGTVSKSALLDYLAISAELCEQLCNLEGYFTEKPPSIDNLVTLKFNTNKSTIQNSHTADVVYFPVEK